jgi:predicted transcriptional regulator
MRGSTRAKAHRRLVQMAEETNSSPREMLDQAIENERPVCFFSRQIWRAKVRQNKKAWKAWRAAATIGPYNTERRFAGKTAARTSSRPNLVSPKGS